MSEPQQWWHVFGGTRPESEWGDCVALLIVGPSSIGPDEISDEHKAEGLGGLAYIESVDHEPTDAEKDVWNEQIEASESEPSDG